MNYAMRIPKSIHENLRFLISEITSQLVNLRLYFDNPSITVAKRILDRSGYTHNLKNNIHNGCLKLILDHKDPYHETALLRSLETIATDLDRIAALCRDTIQQAGYLKKNKHLPSKYYSTLLKHIEKGVAMVDAAVNKSDTRMALKIGRFEQKLNRAYKQALKQHISKLKRKKRKHQTEDVVCTLFIAHSIEQMGDTLLHISEAILSANLGLSFNTDRYHALQASIGEFNQGDTKPTLETVAQTRSGSGISGLNTTDKAGNATSAIYKDGQKKKLKEERDGVESWHQIFPGLAPKILSYHKQGQSAALLIEHIAGETFEQILLYEPPELLKRAMRQLQKTLTLVWDETHTSEAVSAHYMQQLKKRLGSVYRLHPEFSQCHSQLCGVDVPSFDTLLEQATEYERSLKAPFSVYIHGDFNVDNIIYDPLEKRINFIDLHRSTYMDYVQDISVFMVSNYRLQVEDPKLRQRTLDQSYSLYCFAANYAERMGDRSFELRLALGLARSFATSTRFVLDRTLARSMWMRARYLIESVLASKPNNKYFEIPLREIFMAREQST